jgi:predicted nucleic acid-binding Zn ribbon protein
MRRDGFFTSIKELLIQINEVLPFDLEDGQIWKLWKSVVGEHTARHTQPVAIRNKVLTVWVSSSIWLQELRYREKEIIQKLNRMLERDAVEKIRFQMIKR